jgi:GNAT superfamily N-acetyltransferase
MPMQLRRIPVAWMLLFPTTHALMERFLREDIGEVKLLHETPLDGPYEAIYICSALVLEEYRRQGIARRLAADAIRRIMADHSIRSLFIWAFTEAGDRLADTISAETGLPLFRRKKREYP